MLLFKLGFVLSLMWNHQPKRLCKNSRS